MDNFTFLSAIDLRTDTICRPLVVRNAFFRSCVCLSVYALDHIIISVPEAVDGGPKALSMTSYGVTNRMSTPFILYRCRMVMRNTMVLLCTS
jgi:hypothetical protein